MSPTFTLLTALLLAPVTARLAAEAPPDLFENGLVLANPSSKPCLFDLQTIAPGRKFGRIQSRPSQAPGTNNGQPMPT